MHHEQITELARRFIAALHALEDGDERAAEGIAALFADDARLTNAALQLHGHEQRGAAGIREFWVNYRRALGRARSEFHHVMSDGSAAGLFWTTSGTYPDGAPLQYDGVSLLEFDDRGRIVRFQGYYDTRQLTREAGTGA
jgi:ketosteroid isomerase-like protein